jgi:tRNA threonylcarbamoyladenosine biosynthesis protein TsaE
MNSVLDSRIEIVSESVEQTQSLGAQLGAIVQAGDVLALVGDLGAGKTNFAQGLARGLGVTEDVNSPTFILANEYYSGRVPMYHVDAYRVQDAAEAEGFGLDDYLNDDGVTVIEWAERIRAALPPDVLWILFNYLDENQRGLAFIPSGGRAGELVRAMDDAARN